MEPGALAREVNFASSSIQYESNTDCKSKKYLEILIKDSMRSRINGRYYQNEKTGLIEKITPDTPGLTGNVIKLRSPIYCKQPNNNLCSICYGDLAERLDAENIGLLAGAVINKLGLNNYSMKMRHQSSQVQIRKVDFIKDMIKV